MMSYQQQTTSLNYPDDRCWRMTVSMEFFALAVLGDADHLLALRFIPLTQDYIPADPLARTAAHQLHRYLRDPHQHFSLPLAPTGTAYQRRVWHAIAAIPCGETRNYGTLARKLQSGARAVGGACGANPYPIIVPCHRVIASEGGLGGFSHQRKGFLLHIKQQLLAREAA